MNLLPIVDGSDLIATVPRDLARICERQGGIRIVTPPFALPTVEVHQFWHRRFHQSATNACLRTRVHQFLGGGA